MIVVRNGHSIASVSAAFQNADCWRLQLNFYLVNLRTKKITLLRHGLIGPPPHMPDDLRNLRLCHE